MRYYPCVCVQCIHIFECLYPIIYFTYENHSTRIIVAIYLVWAQIFCYVRVYFIYIWWNVRINGEKKRVARRQHLKRYFANKTICAKLFIHRVISFWKVPLSLVLSFIVILWRILLAHRKFVLMWTLLRVVGSM